MLTWTAKDPDATYDYRWNPPLDPGDTLAVASLTKITGDVSDGGQQQDETGVTIILTGGTAGLNLFRGTWTSTGGRSDDEYIQIEVRDDLPVPDPLLAAFRARYSAFAGVADTAVSYWLNDAQRLVGAWGDDRDVGLMAAAARSMVAAKTSGLILPDASGLGGTGITQFKSGTFSAQITDDAANGKIAGPWDDDWLLLVRIYGAGLGVASAGFVPALDCGGPGQWRPR